MPGSLAAGVCGSECFLALGEREEATAVCAALCALSRVFFASCAMLPMLTVFALFAPIAADQRASIDALLDELVALLPFPTKSQSKQPGHAFVRVPASMLAPDSPRDAAESSARTWFTPCFNLHVLPLALQARMWMDITRQRW